MDSHWMDGWMDVTDGNLLVSSPATPVQPWNSIMQTIKINAPSLPPRHLMFQCLECSKVYKTRTSLTRHSHNHASVPLQQHACATCGVVFARRDILNRHVNNGHCASENRGKGRCHTACEGCRAARVKCDGMYAAIPKCLSERLYRWCLESVANQYSRQGSV